MALAASKCKNNIHGNIISRGGGGGMCSLLLIFNTRLFQYFLIVTCIQKYFNNEKSQIMGKKTRTSEEKKTLLWKENVEMNIAQR